MENGFDKKDLEALKKALLEVVQKIEKIERSMENGNRERNIGIIIGRGENLKEIGVVKRVGPKVVLVINTEAGEIKKEYNKLPNREDLKNLLVELQNQGLYSDLTAIYYTLTG